MNSKAVYAIIAAIIVVAALFGIRAIISNSKNSSDQNQVTDQSNQNQNTIQSSCPTPTQADLAARYKPTVDIANKTAVLETNFGTIKIQLYDKDAPKTVENFVRLIQKGYYNGITFHRVAHDFVIQGGDPTGTGRGGQSIYGKPFEDELYCDTPSYQAGYLKGVVAMANSGQNTNGSQFFILLADHSDLPHNYTIFGKVISGQDVVDKIGALPVTPIFNADDGTPKSKVIINKATIQ